MAPHVYFDDSLPKFASLVGRTWGISALIENIVLRDVSGRLTLLLLQQRTAQERANLSQRIVSELGVYVDGGALSIATPADLFFDENKLPESRTVRVNTEANQIVVRIIDQRMIGADWLQEPTPSASDPTRIVFASLKGGVGRSTALCVLASHFASRGLRVLAVDMDLEAPGLGNMLLTSETLPEFGLLDYLVERTLDELGDDFLLEMVSASWLGGGRGRVDVIPAVGRRSMVNPANVLAKIARAYVAGTGPTNETITFTHYLQELIQRVATPTKYDVVLIDARSGLHETTAAALLGLGAEIFLFGSDQPQTFSAFRLLFAHLGTLVENERVRDRLRIVRARTESSKLAITEFASQLNALAREYFSGGSEAYEPDLVGLGHTFNVDWDESEELPIPDLSDDLTVVSIRDDTQFRMFDPQKDRSVLDEGTYLPAFEELVELASRLVSNAIGSPEAI